MASSSAKASSLRSNRKQKRWPKPAKEFKVPVFPGYVYLYTNKRKYQQACKYLNVKKDKAEMEALHGTCMMLVRKGRAIYLLGHFDKKPSTLVHETAHLSNYILRHAEVPVNDVTEEVFCYLLDELVEQLGLDDWEPPMEGI